MPALSTAEAPSPERGKKWGKGRETGNENLGVWEGQWDALLISLSPGFACFIFFFCNLVRF